MGLYSIVRFVFNPTECAGIFVCRPVNCFMCIILYVLPYGDVHVKLVFADALPRFILDHGIF